MSHRRDDKRNYIGPESGNRDIRSSSNRVTPAKSSSQTQEQTLARASAPASQTSLPSLASIAGPFPNPNPPVGHPPQRTGSRPKSIHPNYSEYALRNVHEGRVGEGPPAGPNPSPFPLAHPHQSYEDLPRFSTGSPADYLVEPRNRPEPFPRASSQHPIPPPQSSTQSNVAASGSRSSQSLSSTQKISQSENPLHPLAPGPDSVQTILQLPSSAYPLGPLSRSVHSSPTSLKGRMTPNSQTMTMATPQGLLTFPIDAKAASRSADEKRRRNAGASARFRARRKEKEQHSEQVIDGLQLRIKELTEDVTHYQSERDYFAAIVRRMSGHEQYFPRPVSPRHDRQVNRAETEQTSVSPSSDISQPTFEEHGDRTKEGSLTRRRLEGTSQTPVLQLQGSISSQPQRSFTAPMITSGSTFGKSAVAQASTSASNYHQRYAQALPSQVPMGRGQSSIIPKPVASQGHNVMTGQRQRDIATTLSQTSSPQLPTLPPVSGNSPAYPQTFLQHSRDWPSQMARPPGRR